MLLKNVFKVSNLVRNTGAISFGDSIPSANLNGNKNNLSYKSIAIVGCGFVADYYLKTLSIHPQLKLVGVMDKISERATKFAQFHNVGRIYNSLNDILEDNTVDIVLNLTNPRSHYEVSKACLEAGKHVYSEKPFAMEIEQAKELVDIAENKGLYLSSAPCSLLSETAQTVWKALRENKVGKVRLVYAEMDDGLVQAIEDLLKTSFQFSDIKYEFEHHQIDQRFDEKIEISLYRITQELVNNIIKHSRAKNISVQLLNVKENLLLFVEDDGVGMTENVKGEGHGLLNIRSRLDMINGSINYEPSADSGTSVSIKIPYYKT